ncbi:MAG: hypothetical protein ACYDHE_19645 [Candidatus Acidiferrales bacterium]
MKQHEGLIYGYPHYVGQIQSNTPRRFEKRYRDHKLKHPDWSEPVILERVTGINREDLLFNLAFQETIWMFKLHTYLPIWRSEGGFNLRVSFAKDYISMGQVGGLIGGRMGKRDGKFAKEHPKEASEIGRRGGLAGGKAGAKKTHELYAGTEIRRKWLSEAGKKRAARSNHNRWHLKRGLFNPNCKFCKENKCQTKST